MTTTHPPHHAKTTHNPHLHSPYLQKPFPLTLACPCTTTLCPVMASISLKTFIGHLQFRPCLPRQASSCLHTSSGFHVVAGQFSPEVAGRNLRAIVVGGGPAGGSTVETLAKDGVETFSIERRLDNYKPCGGSIPMCLVGEFDLPLDTIDRRVTKMKMISPSNVVVDIGRTLKPHKYIGMVRHEALDSYLRECASAAGTTIINGLFLKMDAPPNSESHEVGA